MTLHTPPRCANSEMATITTTNKVVLLNTGNYPSYMDFLNQTWTFNGTDWIQISANLIDSAGPLPGRTDMAFTYDGVGNILMYGGRGKTSLVGALQDTWLYNGTTWTLQAPLTSPFGRWKAESAFLSGTGVVLFGGQNALNMLNETWVWNTTTKNWTLQAPVTSPSIRSDHQLEASSSQIIMFGGKNSNSQLNDTWSYNGTTWTQLFPTTSPSVRSSHCMSYDTTNNIWVMFGGMNAYNYLPETWIFNGTNWTQVSIGTGPAGRINAQMSFDTNTNTSLMFGGTSAATNYPSNETWSFNGSSKIWTQL